MINSMDLAAVSHHGIGNESLTGIRPKDSRRFAIAYGRGKRRVFWCRLKGENNRLSDLAQNKNRTQSRPTSGTGITSVPLAKIIGSEGRVDDFDREFNPITLHNRDRWVSIAAARRQGKILPPVDLIQVGEEYYVRDGHHRISVAAASGQREIEARIISILYL